jgi:molybdate transport system ATP-binding protein
MTDPMTDPAMKWDIAIDMRVGTRITNKRPAKSGEDLRFHLDVAFKSDASRLVVFGPSGAGKSLTLMAIAGLMRPEQGHVRIDGETLFDANAKLSVPSRDRRLAYLFQDYALFPHLNVRQNVAFGLNRGWRNPPRRNIDAADEVRVRAWLQTLELDLLADRYPEQLSGGQRQRTALARALIGEPRALLLDEPFSALDRPLRQRLRDELSTLQARLSLPMILITHDAADVEAFGDAIVTIEHGRVVAEKT